jgi:CBS domain-containing protein
MATMIVRPAGPETTSRRRRLDSDTPISRLMSTSAEALGLVVRRPRVAFIDARATVREATRLMVEHGLRQVQVRNREGELVGVLAASDLYRWVTDDVNDPDEAHA